jgi:hypothetical protein
MKTSEYAGSLRKCIEMAKTRSLRERRLYYIKKPQAIPYDRPCEQSTNHDVDLYGTDALCVGVSSFGTDETRKRPLVSDHFASCVPVIAIGRTGTHLAHVNGPVEILTDSRDWWKTHRIMVIKTDQAHQASKAELVLKRLKTLEFKEAAMFHAPFPLRIGIVVIGSTAIAYSHD